MRISFLLAAALCAFHAAAASDKDIVIGQSAAISGSQAQFGKEMRDGALAVFEVVNSHGGIHGRRVEMVTLDDGGSETRTKENTVRLIQHERAVALFGYTSRPSALAGAALASQAKVPFIAPFSGTPALYKQNPYVFTIRASYNDELAAMVEQVVQSGYKRIGFAYLNDARQVNVPLVEKLLEQHGMKPAVLIGVDRSSANVAAQASQLAAANPDVLLALANNLPLTALNREARRLGNGTPFWIVSFVNSKLMVKELGPLATGQVFAQVVPLPTKRGVRIVKDYQRDYRAKFPNAELSFTSLEGYIGARVLAEGLKRAGANPTHEKLVRSLETIGQTDLGDFWIEFSPQNHNGSRYVELTIVDKSGEFLN